MYGDIPLLREEEKIPDCSGITVKALSGMRGQRCGIHWHNYYTIDVITGGHGEHYLNGVVYPIRRGDAYLVRPTDIHMVSGEDLLLHSIRFTDRAILESCRSITQSIHSTFRLEDSQLNRIGIYMDAISDYNSVLANDPDNRLAAEAVRMNFALILILIAGDAPIPAGEDNSQIAAFMHWLDMHFRENPSVENAAAVAGLSPAYFPAWFKKHTGSAYTERLMSLRLSYACAMLKNGFSITDSCFSSGFGSLSHFNHMFKRQYGLTPGTYREKCARRSG